MWGRAISDLRTIASISWKDFFCRVHRSDPSARSCPYAQRMDFETGAVIRHSIEQLARHSPHSEPEVAEDGPSPALGRGGQRPSAGTRTRRLLAGGRGRRGCRAVNRLPPQPRRRASRWCINRTTILYATALIAAIAYHCSSSRNCPDSHSIHLTLGDDADPSRRVAPASRWPSRKRSGSIYDGHALLARC